MYSRKSYLKALVSHHLAAYTRKRPTPSSTSYTREEYVTAFYHIISLTKSARIFQTPLRNDYMGPIC
jgi:hypothetical protein